MKQVKIALVRFYNAKFTKLKSKEEIIWEFTYQDLNVVARLSKTTSYSKWGPHTLGFPTQSGSSNPPTQLSEAGPHKYPAELYFEVMVFKTVEVTIEQFESLQKGNTNMIAELRKQFRHYEQQMRQGIDYCAGMLGTRVHPELVTIPIFDLDQHYVFMNENYYNVQSGLVVQFKSNVEIISALEGRIQHDVKKIRLDHQKKLTSAEKLCMATESLSWLLRGWSAEDSVLRFISFFTALEPILPPYTTIKKEIFKEIREKLIELICGSDLAKDLPAEKYDQFILQHQLRPSLFDRFKQMASDAQLPGWEKDIDDFKLYNSIRNGLLHRGDFPIAKEPYVDHDTLKSFEALVHKYVAFLLYGVSKLVQANNTRKTIISISANFKD